MFRAAPPSDTPKGDEMSFRPKSGYVIHAEGTTWLWEYCSRWQCPQHYAGEPVGFNAKKFGHEPVSNELKAKFAVWAFTLVEKARLKLNEPKEYEAAMRRVDATGKWLAVLLRAEIGSGPVILYRDLLRDPCGGPHVWEVTDDVALQPYWHRRSAGYIIDHESTGEWAWEYRPAHYYRIGSAAGCGEQWYGEQPIPRELARAFSRWHDQWREAVEAQGDHPQRIGDWDAFNQEGLALGRRLKLAVGAAYKVIYLRPFEEPEGDVPWGAVELRLDGSMRPCEQGPYWDSTGAMSS